MAYLWKVLLYALLQGLAATQLCAQTAQRAGWREGRNQSPCGSRWGRKEGAASLWGKPLLFHIAMSASCRQTKVQEGLTSAKDSIEKRLRQKHGYSCAYTPPYPTPSTSHVHGDLFQSLSWLPFFTPYYSLLMQFTCPVSRACRALRVLAGPPGGALNVGRDKLAEHIDVNVSTSSRGQTLRVCCLTPTLAPGLSRSTWCRDKHGSASVAVACAKSWRIGQESVIIFIRHHGAFFQP